MGLILLLGLYAIVATPAVAQTAPTPEQVRACVERNGTRYQNPGTSVDAQYADAESACRAALENGDVTAQFEPSDDSDVTPTPPTSSSGAEGSGGSGADTPAPGRAGDADGPRASSPKAIGSARPTTTSRALRSQANSAAVVRRAIERADSGAGSPFPSSLSGGSPAAYGALAGAGALILGAGIMAIRRRPN